MRMSVCKKMGLSYLTRTENQTFVTFDFCKNLLNFENRRNLQESRVTKWSGVA